jgi:hypothetical protein
VNGDGVAGGEGVNGDGVAGGEGVNGDGVAEQSLLDQSHAPVGQYSLPVELPDTHVPFAGHQPQVGMLVQPMHVDWELQLSQLLNTYRKEHDMNTLVHSMTIAGPTTFIT